MSSRGPYRRHAAQFKLQLCQDIGSGELGRRDAQKKYSLSANLIQIWLTQFDNGELAGEEVEASMVIARAFFWTLVDSRSAALVVSNSLHSSGSPACTGTSTFWFTT